MYPPSSVTPPYISSTLGCAMLLCQRIARIAAIAPLRAGEEIAASAGGRQCYVPNAFTSPIFDKKKKDETYRGAVLVCCRPCPLLGAVPCLACFIALCQVGLGCVALTCRPFSAAERVESHSLSRICPPPSIYQRYIWRLPYLIPLPLASTPSQAPR